MLDLRNAVAKVMHCSEIIFFFFFEIIIKATGLTFTQNLESDWSGNDVLTNSER